MGVVITAMINTLALIYLEKNKKFALIILCFIAVYDILSTAAGQSIFIIMVDNQVSKIRISKIELMLEKEIKELSAEIEQLNSEYMDKLEQINKTVKNLSDAADYGKTRPQIEREKEILYMRMEEKKEMRVSKRDELKKEINNEEYIIIKSIYHYYAELTINPTWEIWSQFSMHLILSIIISGAAPLGIYLMSPPQVIEKKIIENFLKLKEIQIFARVAWNEMSNKKINVLPTRTEIIKKSQKLIATFNDRKLEQIIKIAISKGLLKIKANGIYPEKNIIDSEDFIKKFIE